MSHFTITVVGDNIEEQLEPYMEQTEDPQYIEFEDTEEEDMDNYLNNSVDKVIMPDGRILSPWDNELRIDNNEHGFGTGTHGVPEGAVKKQVPFTETYGSFEEYQKEWHGREKDPVENKYGYWHNPNAKWDWYSVGGRWSGYWKLKSYVSDKEHQLGEPGAFNNEPTLGGTDCTLKKNIDFEGMVDEARERARKRWITYYEEIKPLKESGDEKKIEKASSLMFDKVGWVMKDDPIFTKTLDEYIDCAEIPSTFALLWDGKWYEQGTMGWFGVSWDHESQWNGNFIELWNSIPDDEIITLVDCHI